MTQNQLDQAIAQATGDDLALIRQRGFSLWHPTDDDDHDELPPPQMVDWDELDSQR